eukprot:1195233-Prorocentrum_minimum.AAC.1
MKAAGGRSSQLPSAGPRGGGGSERRARWGGGGGQRGVPGRQGGHRKTHPQVVRQREGGPRDHLGRDGLHPGAPFNSTANNMVTEWGPRQLWGKPFVP